METGFYYLQTRYYDPDIGRFISPDSLNYLEPETINGLNLYAYCLNNPVMYADPEGHFVISATTFLIYGLIIGGVVGGTIGGISAYNSGQNVVGGILSGAILGAAVGGIIGYSVAQQTMLLISGGLSSSVGKLISDTFYTIISGENSFGSLSDYALTFVSGAIFKMDFFKIHKTLKNIVDILVVPAVNQLIDMGLTGDEFSLIDYTYDSVSRGLTSWIEYKPIKLFGLNINWSKSMARGFFSVWKREYAIW